MHEFRNKLEVETPLGWGHAILIENGNNDALWTVILAESLAIVTFRQNQLKACRNYTLCWGFSDEEMKAILDKWSEGRK
jgi:hypothetical protein